MDTDAEAIDEGVIIVSKIHFHLEAVSLDCMLTVHPFW